jgi:hypothetical protein
MFQAMVCCFSMVQRVLARQTNSKKSASDSRDSAGSSGSVDPSKGNSSIINDGSNVVDNDPLPARAVTSGEAAERVWKYLNMIPSLMEVGIEREDVICDTYKYSTFN